AEAFRLAHGWMNDRNSIAPDTVVPILTSAARHGDRAFFDDLVAQALQSHSQRDRYSIAAALAAFDDSALVRAGLDLLLSGKLDARELTAMLQPRKETQAILWDFVKENFDRLNTKLPGARGIPFGATLPLTARGFCDEKDRADVERFFSTRIADLSGGARNLNTALESIRLCEARKSALAAGLVAFLARY
ncbi:MAG: ERAP1-like C-terminal domain-containing protein, partial [Acidobacteriota bacterium]|nr:ERAP1-like C-terminal domain-containing protein [Acidobacteriota bacterium]